MDDTRTQLDNTVRSGAADDDQIAAWLGPRAQATLATGFDPGHEELFASWYADVMSPIGLDEQRCRDLFEGRVDPAQFAAAHDVETQRRFLRMYPALSAAHRRYVLGQED